MNILSRAVCILTCGFINAHTATTPIALGTIALDPAAFTPLIEHISNASDRVLQAITTIHDDIHGVHDQTLTSIERMHKDRCSAVLLGTLGTVLVAWCSMRWATTRSTAHVAQWTPGWKCARWYKCWFNQTPGYDMVARDMVISPELERKVRHILWSYQLPACMDQRFATVLIEGPPGTGKTKLAEVIGHASNLPVCRIHAGSLTHMDACQAALAVQELFDTIRASSPCMLIIDEAELLLSVRGATRNPYENVVYLFLQELEALRNIATVILVVNDSNMLDSAIRDRVTLWLQVDYPDHDERVRLVEYFVQRANLAGVSREVLENSHLIAMLARGSDKLSGRHLQHRVQQWVHMYCAVGDVAFRPDMIEQCLKNFMA